MNSFSASNVKFRRNGKKVLERDRKRAKSNPKGETLIEKFKKDSGPTIIFGIVLTVFCISPSFFPCIPDALAEPLLAKDKIIEYREQKISNSEHIQLWKQEPEKADEETPSRNMVIAGYKGDNDNADSASSCQWTRIAPAGCEVHAVAVDHQNDKTVFAGTRGGGLFKSTDGGRNWLAMGCRLPDDNIMAVAVSPFDANLVIAGMERGGIYRSADGGTTWEKAVDGLPEHGYGFYAVARILFSPDRETVYAVAAGQVYTAYPGSWKWSKMSRGLPGDADVRSRIVSPLNPEILYAGTFGYGIYKISDGAKTWHSLGAGPQGKPIWGMAIHPTKPDIVYAGTGGNGIYRSADAGETWNPVNEGIDRTGYVVEAVSVVPSRPDTVYIGTWGGGVWRSKNGGQTWARLQNGMEASGIFDIAVHPKTPSRLYVGSATEGAFTSQDGGEHWQAKGEELKEKNGRVLAADPTNQDIVFIGTYMGSLYRSADGGMNGEKQLKGFEVQSVSAVATDPKNAGTVYVGTAYRRVFRGLDYDR